MISTQQWSFKTYFGSVYAFSPILYSNNDNCITAPARTVLLKRKQLLSTSNNHRKFRIFGKSTISLHGQQKQYISSTAIRLSSHDTNKPMELWLDLRGTKVSPQIAVDHLHQNVHSQDDGDNDINKLMVDKILVSIPDNASSVPNNDGFEKEITLLFAATAANKMSDDTGITSIIYGDSTKDENSVMGKVMNFEQMETKSSLSMYANPITALDIIQNGEWLLLDSTTAKNNNNGGDSSIIDDERSGALLNFIDIVSLGCTSSSAFTLIDGGDKRINSINNDDVAGGIAICCTKNADILQMGAYLEGSGGGGSKTTKSGIYIIQESPEEEDDDKKSTTIKYAIALPFDIELWKTASLL